LAVLCLEGAVGSEDFAEGFGVFGVLGFGGAVVEGNVGCTVTLIIDIQRRFLPIVLFVRPHVLKDASTELSLRRTLLLALLAEQMVDLFILKRNHPDRLVQPVFRLGAQRGADLLAASLLCFANFGAVVFGVFLGRCLFLVFPGCLLRHRYNKIVGDPKSLQLNIEKLSAISLFSGSYVTMKISTPQ